jgi:hypothetical protein
MLRGIRWYRPAQCEQLDEVVECFMGVLLQSYAANCNVPQHGTGKGRQFGHTPENIAHFKPHCSKSRIDDRESQGYLFDNACVTESLALTGAVTIARLGARGKDPS